MQLFMKPVCLLIAFFFTSHSFAQNEMAKQFRAIVNDTANGFPHFRGEIKEVIKPKRILEYFTTSSLENTGPNKIIYIGDESRESYAYVAPITDSVNETEARRIVREWSNKIISFMGDSFEMKKYEPEYSQLKSYGWKNDLETLVISIDIDPVEHTDLKRVSLMICYFSFKPQKDR